MGDHNKRDCWKCGSLLHHENDCISNDVRFKIIAKENQDLLPQVGDILSLNQVAELMECNAKVLFEQSFMAAQMMAHRYTLEIIKPK